MNVSHTVLQIKTSGQGMHEITSQIESLLAGNPISDGICQLFVRHTSASLVIQENADPSAKEDLEGWMNRLVPENNRHFTHTLEGADDMPSHIKSALTATSLSVPLMGGRLGIGTWQGIYLWEHRHRGSTRQVVVTLMGVKQP